MDFQDFLVFESLNTNVNFPKKFLKKNHYFFISDQKYPLGLFLAWKHHLGPNSALRHIFRWFWAKNSKLIFLRTKIAYFAVSCTIIVMWKLKVLFESIFSEKTGNLGLKMMLWHEIENRHFALQPPDLVLTHTFYACLLQTWALACHKLYKSSRFWEKLSEYDLGLPYNLFH